MKLKFWSKNADPSEVPQEWTEPCPHDDWTVEGRHGLGNGLCVKCGTEMGLPELMRNWKARIEREIKAALAK